MIQDYVTTLGRRVDISYYHTYHIHMKAIISLPRSQARAILPARAAPRRVRSYDTLLCIVLTIPIIGNWDGTMGRWDDGTMANSHDGTRSIMNQSVEHACSNDE